MANWTAMSLNRSQPGKKIKIKKYRESSFEIIDDIIPAELMLTISLNGTARATISCTPANIIELTAGFLINNGYIINYSDINIIKICGSEVDKIIKKDDLSITVEVDARIKAGSGNIFPSIPESSRTTVETNSEAFIENDVETNAEAVAEAVTENNKGTNAEINDSRAPEQAHGIRSVFGRNYKPSACGSIDDFITGLKIKKIKSRFKVGPDIINTLGNKTIKAQKLKKSFGGLHSAALFDTGGELAVIYEDIGRHNCLDKIAGYMQIKRIDPSNSIIFTTGRLSMDVIYKLSVMKIPVIVTNSSLTFAAAKFAKKAGITAIGYARGKRFNIYSNPGRIIE